MDININVTLDSGTTKAIALLAESILAASAELRSTAPSGPVTAEVAAEPEKPPKRTRRSRAKPAEAKPDADEGKESSPATEPAPAAKITREAVRKAAGAFLEAGKDRTDVKGWLEEFGAESITTLDEKHLPEMHERLTA